MVLDAMTLSQDDPVDVLAMRLNPLFPARVTVIAAPALSYEEITAPAGPDDAVADIMDPDNVFAIPQNAPAAVLQTLATHLNAPAELKAKIELMAAPPVFAGTIDLVTSRTTTPAPKFPCAPMYTNELSLTTLGAQLLMVIPSTMTDH